jgi:hypothetical protein
MRGEDEKYDRTANLDFAISCQNRQGIQREVCVNSPNVQSRFLCQKALRARRQRACRITREMLWLLTFR